MLELSRDLKPEEVNLITAQVRNEKINYWLNILKTIVLVMTVLGSALGSAWLYFNLNKPEDDRERIKLVLEVIKEKDPFIQRVGMDMIKEVYPTESNRLKEIDKKIIDNSDLQELNLKKRQAEEELIKTENEQERKMIRENIEKLNNNIRSIQSSSKEQ